MEGQPLAASPGFLSGEGEMATLIRNFDWSKHPLGPPDDWPAGLKTTVQIALTTMHPVVVYWGPTHFCLYNDAFRLSLGPEKHPQMLATEAAAFWPEVWSQLAPQAEKVMAGGAATWHENQLVPIVRDGRLQEIYWTYSWSPIYDGSAPHGVGGALVICNETTPQVLAVQRLASERERFEQLFEQAPTFMAVVQGPQHIILTVNPGYKRLVGDRPLIGLPIVQALPDAAAQGFIEPLDKAFATGTPYTAAGAKYDASFDGGAPVTRYVDFVFQPMSDSSGKVTGIFIAGVDVTERRAAEQALALSEEQLRLATEAAEIGLWDFDILEEKLFWPARVKAMFGISPDEPVSIADYYGGLHPGDRDTTTAAFRSAMDPATKAFYDVEYRTVGKEDGVVRWVAAKGRGIFDDTGTCVRIIGTAIDISERRRNEEDLRELNRTLEQRVAQSLAERNILASIVEGTSAFVQVVDLQYRWIAINRASTQEFARIFGHRPKVGECMLDVLSYRPDHALAVKAVWDRALAGEEFTEVGQFGDPSMDSRHYEMRFNNLFDSEGQRVGAYQFVFDVTDRILAQRRLAHAESALLQARKMEAIGRLTGGVAHDFNNVLQAVRGSLDLIRRRPADAERVRTLAERGVDATRRGGKLTAQLLTFSREQSPELRPVAVAPLLKGLEDLLRTTLGPTRRLTLEVTDGELVVVADKTQLEMAILNLAVNARDAMEDGGHLTVTARPMQVTLDHEIPPGDYVEIAATDTGAGMSAEVQARAFDPFFTTKDVGRGSGLGLSQVYGMTHRAGGAARIESREKRGTSVMLLLRRTQEVDTEASSTPLTSLDYEIPSARTVLVVDDDPDVRQFLVEALVSIVYLVIEADGGRAGLELLGRQKPDALVVDFAMPDINGAEVAREVRKVHAALPILMVSGFADSAAIDAAAGGGIPLLRKPFDVSALQASLERAFLQQVA